MLFRCFSPLFVCVPNLFAMSSRQLETNCTCYHRTYILCKLLISHSLSLLYPSLSLSISISLFFFCISQCFSLLSPYLRFSLSHFHSQYPFSHSPSFALLYFPLSFPFYFFFLLSLFHPVISPPVFLPYLTLPFFLTTTHTYSQSCTA